MRIVALWALAVLLCLPVSAQNVPLRLGIVIAADDPDGTACTYGSSPVQFYLTTGAMFCCQDANPDVYAACPSPVAAGEWTDNGTDLQPSDAADDWIRLSGDAGAAAIGSTAGTNINFDFDGDLSSDMTFRYASDVMDFLVANATDQVFEFDNATGNFIVEVDGIRDIDGPGTLWNIGTDGAARFASVVSDRALAPGGHHRIVIFGDSIAAETPYINATANGTTQWLINAFAEDSNYTATTGSNLGATTSTTGGDWTINTDTGTCSTTCSNNSNITCSEDVDCGGWDQDEATLHLTADNDVGFGFYKGRATYHCGNSSTGCDVSGFTEDAPILISFEVDASDLDRMPITPAAGGSVYTVNNASGTNDFDYLDVDIDLQGTCDGASDQYTPFGNASLSGGTILKITHGSGWTRYHAVFDPTNVSWSNADHSTALAANDCQLRILFSLISEASDSIRTVSIRNLDIYETTSSVQVIRYGRGSNTITGVEGTDCDYDDAKAKFYTSQAHPMDVAVISVGGNDFDGQTPPSNTGCGDEAVDDPKVYFDALENLKGDADTDSVVMVKMLTPPKQFEGGPWNTGSAEADVTAWRNFAVQERDALDRIGITWIDTMDYLQFDQSREIVNVTLDPADFPAMDAGAVVNIPLGSTPFREPTYISRVLLLSDTATADSDADDEWCFGVDNMTASETLTATKTCTGTTEISAWTPYAIALDQNQSISRQDVLALTIDLEDNGDDAGICSAPNTQTPCDLASYKIVAQMEMQTWRWGNQALLFWDNAHLSLLGYKLHAERIYESLTGTQPAGSR